MTAAKPSADKTGREKVLAGSACPLCQRNLGMKPHAAKVFMCPEGHVYEATAYDVGDETAIEQAFEHLIKTLEDRQREMRALAAELADFPEESLRVLQHADDLQPLSEGLHKLSSRYQEIASATF